MTAAESKSAEWQPTSSAQVSKDFLSEADDLLTRYLFDWVLFDEAVEGGRRTGKMNIDGIERQQRAIRRIDQDRALCAQVVKELRLGLCSVQSGIDRLAKVRAFEEFGERYEDGDMLFLHHLKRYLVAFAPESKVAFHETNRYARAPKSASIRQTPSPTPPPGLVNASKQVIGNSVGGGDSAGHIEVAVFATAKIKKGEELSLRGGVADITDKEDDELRKSGQKAEFSVLYSSRKQCFGILLGPARFVNHDCRNNVRFEFGVTGMKLIAIEDIEPDQEIFTHYGIHYFELNNAGCLCATCELRKCGGFTPKDKPQPAAPAVPRKKPTSPTRRSGRNSMGGPPPGTGHELTAQRLINDGPSRGRSDSTASSSSAPASGSRRNERRSSSSVQDDLRKLPRLVHPKLPPPPLYRDDYLFDSRKKTIQYVGPGAAPKKRATSHSAPPSPVKRKRATEPAPASPVKRQKVEKAKDEEPSAGKTKRQFPVKPPKRRGPGRPFGSKSSWNRVKEDVAPIEASPVEPQAEPIDQVAFAFVPPEPERKPEPLARAPLSPLRQARAPSPELAAPQPVKMEIVEQAEEKDAEAEWADEEPNEEPERKINATKGHKGFIKVKKRPDQSATPPKAAQPRGRKKRLSEPTRRTSRSFSSAINYKEPSEDEFASGSDHDDDGASSSTDCDESVAVAELLLSRSHSSSEGFQSGDDSEPDMNESDLIIIKYTTPTKPQIKSNAASDFNNRQPRGNQTPTTTPRRRRPPIDAESPTQPNASPSASSNQQSPSAAATSSAGPSRAAFATSSSGFGSLGANGAGGNGGDDDDDRKPPKPVIDLAADLDEEEEQPRKMQIDQAEPPKTPSLPAGMLTPGLSASGRDETDQEAARLLLAMGSLFGSSSASLTTSASAAALSSSNSARSDEAGPSSAKANGKRRAIDDAPKKDEPEASSKASRRRSNIIEPSPVRSPRGADKRRVSQLGSSRSASGSRSPAGEGSRSTRASNPIKVAVQDLLASKEVAGVSGTFDPTTGKYFSARRSASLGTGLDLLTLDRPSPSPGPSDAPSPLTVASTSSSSSLLEMKPPPRPSGPTPLGGRSSKLGPIAGSSKLRSRVSTGSIADKPKPPASPASKPSAQQPRKAVPPPPPVASVSAPAVVARPPSRSSRPTRASFPMENTALDVLLHAPGAVGGSGYDPVTGKYLPIRRKIDSPPTTSAEAATELTPEPEPEPSPPAGPSGFIAPLPPPAPPPVPPPRMTAAEVLASSARSTRRSQPITIPLSELMADPSVGSVAGRWSEELGKYVSPARQNAARAGGGK